MYIILIILLVLMVAGGIPGGPVHSNFGYYPSGGLGLIFIILLILLLMGRL